MSTLSSRRAAFRKLHESGCFVIPNPWDVGSAMYLQHLGFQAVATSSSGFAFTRGLSDAPDVSRRQLVLGHLADISKAVSIPVNADFQAGYAEDLEELAESVRLCVESGVAGLSIEDATGDKDMPLYELSEAIDRIKVARSVIDAYGADVMLTARSECFLVGHPDPLNESIKRLQAFSEAGADVLFAPGPGNRDIIRIIVESVSPKPANVIMSAYSGLTVSDLAELGVRRISVGSALARAAWTGFINAAKQIATEGSFAGLDGLVSFSDLNNFFAEKHHQ